PLSRPPTPTLFPYTTLFRSHPPSVRRPGFDRGKPEVLGILGGTPDEARCRIPTPTSGYPQTSCLLLRPSVSRLREICTYGSNGGDRKSTRLNSSHLGISYAV